MNHNEPGFLQGTIKARRSSKITVRAFVRQKGKHPFPKASSDADKIRVHSHHWHTFQLQFPTESRISSLGRDVSVTGLRSIHYWRIAN
jgi:hypothetical protein